MKRQPRRVERHRERLLAAVPTSKGFTRCLGEKDVEIVCPLSTPCRPIIPGLVREPTAEQTR